MDLCFTPMKTKNHSWKRLFIFHPPPFWGSTNLSFLEGYDFSSSTRSLGEDGSELPEYPKPLKNGVFGVARMVIQPFQTAWDLVPPVVGGCFFLENHPPKCSL